MGELMILRNEVADLGDELSDEETKKTEIEEDIKTLQAQVEEKKVEAGKESRRKNRLDKELRELKKTVEGATLELNNKHEAIKQGEIDLAAMDQQLRNARVQYEKYIKIYDALFRQTKELTAGEPLSLSYLSQLVLSHLLLSHLLLSHLLLSHLIHLSTN